MEFFLEMVLTAVVALLFSFVVAKLVSVATAGGGNGSGSESVGRSGIHVGEDVVMEELQFGQKVEARVLESERNVGIVEENVEHVDRFVGEAVRVDELEYAATGSGEIGDEREELSIEASEAESAAPENVIPEEIVRGQEEREAESGAGVSPENVIAEEMIVRGEDEGKAESAAAVSPGNVIAEEMVVRGQEERKSETAAAVSPENVGAEETIIRGQEEGSESADERSDRGDVALAESEEVRVEESECKEGIQEKTEELNIEEEDDDDDDWEGIETSELQKAFAAAAKFVEESGEMLENTELYGLHKIATEGPCRDSPPMALMVSARAKWNAWQKLGNMSQEEAMEQYLAILSKEIPGWVHASSIVEKKPEMGNSLVLPPDSGSLEPRLPSNTTDSKIEAVEGDVNGASNLDNKAKSQCGV